MVWGLSHTGFAFVPQSESDEETDDFLAFGEEMIVGYNLKHDVGDTIVDLARKNNCHEMLTGLEELLKPVLSADELSSSEEPELSGGASSGTGSCVQGKPPL